jgi:hypothetical protein
MRAEQIVQRIHLGNLVADVRDGGDKSHKSRSVLPELAR